MCYLFFGVALFGLTHPMAKVFLDLNLSVPHFVWLFLVFRTLLQLPIVLVLKKWPLPSKRSFFELLALGAVGALLHFTEIKSLNLGMAVPEISFIISTHPVWTQGLKFLFGSTRLSLWAGLKVVVAMIGVGLLLGTSLSQFSELIFIPLIASVAFSFWILGSSQIQSQGVSTPTLSFYYDLFSLLFVSLLWWSFEGMNFPIQNLFSLSSPVVFSVLFYSLFVGLIANYLFFLGVKQKGSMAGSYALLLEPIVSSFCSSILFNQYLSKYFFVGAFLIIIANVPDTFWFHCGFNFKRKKVAE